MILHTLKNLYKQLIPSIAFQCHCPNQDSRRDIDHLCILSDDGVWIQFLCGNNPIDLKKQQLIWLGEVSCALTFNLLAKWVRYWQCNNEVSSPNSRWTLLGVLILKCSSFAQDDFSFCWTKEGSRRQLKTTSEPNVLTFESVSEKDFGYYRCEVKEAERVVLTVYRALYGDESSTSCVEPSLSGVFSIVC